MADSNDILSIPKREQYRTVEELIENSRPSFKYYFLLIISSLIVASGLLLGNNAIVIGGMIVTPVLTPVLTIALGIIVGKGALLRREALFLIKSFGIIIATAFALTFLFGEPLEAFIFDNSMRAAILYFIVAFSAGSAASFAYSHKNISDILPGIAVAVSVVPPVSLIGLGLAIPDLELARFYFIVFVLNTIGIVMGGIVVLSFLKFSRVEKRVDEEIKEIEKEEEEKEEEKIKEEEEKEKADKDSS